MIDKIKKGGTSVIRCVLHLDRNVFSPNERCVSLGMLSSDIIQSITEHSQEIGNALSSENDIVFWQNRIAHIERHRNDFESDTQFELCFRDIPSIIRSPDYISIHPDGNSISFIKDYGNYISVAIRVSSNGRLSFRTMYPLRNSQLQTYIARGQAWRFEHT